jgi:hypothetical protein
MARLKMNKALGSYAARQFSQKNIPSFHYLKAIQAKIKPRPFPAGVPYPQNL